MTRVRAALVGTFVLGGIVLLFAMLSLWFNKQLNQQLYEHVTYFRGSAAGLKVGGAVRLRGLKVGTISRIRLFSLDDPANLVIGVYIAFDESRVRNIGVNMAPTPAMVAQAVRKGLRARLGGARPIIGDRTIELDFLPDAKIVSERPRDADDTPEIPLVAAPRNDAARALDDLMSRLDELDLPELTASLTRAADRIADSSAAFTKLAGTLDGKIDSAFGVHAPWMVDLRRTLASIDKAAAQFAGLAQYLRRNPSSLIRGKPKDEP